MDLDRLEYDQIDSVFARLGGTRAIIFDMRGYPKGVTWALAPRLANTARTAAVLTTPLVGYPAPPPAAVRFEQIVEPAPAEKRYTGRTFMLMDERTVSQAEHTGLYLKAANQTTFVGSATAGANGEVANVVLPGGVTMGFTGQGIMFPDGRQLQRRGLQPDIPVTETLAGIRSGRDEVLEAALRAARN